MKEHQQGRRSGGRDVGEEAGVDRIKYTLNEDETGRGKKLFK